MEDAWTNRSYTLTLTLTLTKKVIFMPLQINMYGSDSDVSPAAVPNTSKEENREELLD